MDWSEQRREGYSSARALGCALWAIILGAVAVTASLIVLSIGK